MSVIESKTVFKNPWEQPIAPKGIVCSGDWISPENAFDGNDSTYASCGTSTDFIRYDLGEPVCITKISGIGNFAGSVARSMGLRAWALINGKEVFLGESNIPENLAVYPLEILLDTPVETSTLIFRLAEKNISGDAPTTSYRTRIASILAEGYLSGSLEDYTSLGREITPYGIREDEKEYWKLGTEMNVAVNGTFSSVTEEGVASGWSGSSFLSIPDKLDLASGKDWEILFKFRTGLSNITDNQTVFSVPSYCLAFNIANSKTSLYLSSNGSSWNIASALAGTTTLKTETWYYGKLSFDGSKYILELSEDGINWVVENSISSSVPVNNSAGVFTIGRYNTNVAFANTGLIVLSQSYIKINGELWWSGSNYTHEGYWVDEYQNIVTKFSSSQNLSAIGAMCSDSLPWECQMKTKMVSPGTTQYCINTYKAGSYSHLLGMVSSKISCWISSNGSSWNIASNLQGTTTLVAGTIYWIRWGWTGTEYYIDLSTDGKTWNREVTRESSLPIFGNHSRSAWGYGWTSDPMLSPLYLEDCYIKIDGKYWWTGMKPIASSSEDALYSSTKKRLYPLCSRTRNYYKSIFETEVGGTYTVSIPPAEKCRITLVGGGGAAAIRGVYDDKGYGWGGGSGGAMVAEFVVPPGDYEVVVGTANNNAQSQGGNSTTRNPLDATTHDSYITGIARVGGGGSGHYNPSYVGAAGAAPTYEIEPLTVMLASEGNVGKYNSGGKGSAGAATCAGGASVYWGYGTGQGCKTSEYANKRSWINGSAGFCRIEIPEPGGNSIWK